MCEHGRRVNEDVLVYADGAVRDTLGRRVLLTRRGGLFHLVLPHRDLVDEPCRQELAQHFQLLGQCNSEVRVDRIVYRE